MTPADHVPLTRTDRALMGVLRATATAAQAVGQDDRPSGVLRCAEVLLLALEAGDLLGAANALDRYRLDVVLNARLDDLVNGDPR